MIVALTGRTPITAKNGTKYIIYRGLGEDGDTVQLFLNEEEESQHSIPTSTINTATRIKSALKDLALVDIQFNQRGRMVSIDTGENE